MRILVLNGSPRPKLSNTMKLSTAFLEGMARQQPAWTDIETIDISKERIEPCLGCFSCWEKTPGKCVIPDDMGKLLQKFREADLVVWSFPLYYFGLPSKMKAFLDRQLPLLLPFINEETDGTAVHPQRYDLSAQRHIVISTCGFFTIENNYDALIKQFDCMFAGTYTKILCPQGELFRIPELRTRTDEYLELLRKAGSEYAVNGRILDDTEALLAVPLYPKEKFLIMANASWNNTGTETTPLGKAPVQMSQGERLLRQMTAVYTPAANAPKGEKHIEFFYTDTAETFQIKVGGSKAEFINDPAAFSPYSVRIETPLDVWQDISLGKITGTEALFRNKYRVLGDFSLMTSVMDGFSVKKKTPAPQKKRSMVILLMPFMALWILLLVFGYNGALAAILVSACVPLLTRYFRLSPYDSAAPIIISALSVAHIAGLPMEITVTFSYVLFGGLWLISLFCRLPLCAWYSANAYGGDEAFNNPLFIKTNKILSGFWGVLYLALSVVTWFLMRSDFAPFTGLINSIAPALAGIVTAVFVKWYPAHYTRRPIA